MGGLTIENNFFILKIEKKNKIIVFDFPKVGAGAQKSGGAAALPAPPPPRSLLTHKPSKVTLFLEISKEIFKSIKRTLSTWPCTLVVLRSYMTGAA